MMNIFYSKTQILLEVINSPNRVMTLHWSKGQKSGNRDLEQWRQLVKNEFILNQWISQLFKSVQYANGFKNGAQAKYATMGFNSKWKYSKLVDVVHVPQTSQNLVILRSCFIENGKEMYTALTHTCKANCFAH